MDEITYPPEEPLEDYDQWLEELETVWREQGTEPPEPISS